MVREVVLMLVVDVDVDVEEVLECGLLRQEFASLSLLTLSKAGRFGLLS
jgi:hypothetical protein